MPKYRVVVDSPFMLGKHEVLLEGADEDEVRREAARRAILVEQRLDPEDEEALDGVMAYADAREIVPDPPKVVFCATAHQQWDDDVDSFVDMLVETDGVPAHLARQIAEQHSPLYEVEFDFEYHPSGDPAQHGRLRCTEIRLSDNGRDARGARAFVPKEPVE